VQSKCLVKFLSKLDEKREEERSKPKEMVDIYIDISSQLDTEGKPRPRT